jgi:hypothetical protein
MSLSLPDAHFLNFYLFSSLYVPPSLCTSLPAFLPTRFWRLITGGPFLSHSLPLALFIKLPHVPCIWLCLDLRVCPRAAVSFTLSWLSLSPPALFVTASRYLYLSMYLSELLSPIRLRVFVCLCQCTCMSVNLFVRVSACVRVCGSVGPGMTLTPCGVATRRRQKSRSRQRPYRRSRASGGSQIRVI